MQILLCRQPSAVLRNFVRGYAQREIDKATPGVQQVMTARLEPTLEFQFQERIQWLDPNQDAYTGPEALIVGGFVNPVQLSFAPGTQSFGVFFHPTGFSRLFGIGVNHLFSRFYDAQSVLGHKVEGLRLELADAPTFEKRVAIAENFLSLQLSLLMPDDSIWRIADFIFAQKGAVRMKDAAERDGTSIRQLERKFQRQIGITPKLFARIARFQFALDTKIGSPDRAWLNIAHELGYHDQMHMVKDFYDIAGCAPGTLLGSIGDGRPPAHLCVSEDGGTHRATIPFSRTEGGAFPATKFAG